MNNRIARCISLCVLAAAALAAVGADKAAPKPADKPRVIKVESAYLRLIDHVDVPAQAGGVLAQIPVREGTLVKENELLVQMDDVDASLALDQIGRASCRERV